MKKFNRWVNRENYITGLKIAQKYYPAKIEGSFVNLISASFLYLYLKRLFFLLLRLLQKDKNLGLHDLKINSVRKFFSWLLGFYEIRPSNLDLSTQHLPILFQENESPSVTIVITDFSEHNYTYNCLLSVLRYTTDVSYEVLLLVNHPAEQYNWLRSNSSLKIHKNQADNTSNLQNDLLNAARGEFVCLIDNTTQVSDGWLKNLLTVYDYHPSTGLVSSKLIFPCGLLKEAGADIDHRDKRVSYGKYEDSNEFKYNYIREITCCSESGLLIRRTDLEKIPPLCFTDNFISLSCSVRGELKKRIYYQPLSSIIHFKKNENEHETLHIKETQCQLKATVLEPNNSILVIDAVIPKPDQDSGSRRLFEIIKLFQSLDLDVYFMPHDGFKTDPYYTNLVNIGVKVIYTIHPKEKQDLNLKSILPSIDIVWISRPDINDKYGLLIKSIKPIPWIYDTVDLHFIRLQRGFELAGLNPGEIEDKIKPIREQELKIAGLATYTVTVTDVEKQILQNNGIKNVSVIPNVHPEMESDLIEVSFEKRQGIVFIGSYAHQPNVDAALWLTNDIMPLVWKTNPEIKLCLLGSKPPPEVSKLKSELIEVPGFLPDVSKYFLNSRVFVAPLRYGAGMKGKIGQSLEYRLPIVSTSIGIEGMGLVDQVNVLVGESAVEFAGKIIDLYNSPELWNTIRINSGHVLKQYSPENVQKSLRQLLNDVTLRNKIQSNER